MLGFGLVLPYLALYARSFGVSYAAAGLFVAAAGITRLGTDVVAGSLVDRFGVRGSTSVGVVILGVASLGTALAPNFHTAVVAWGVGGCGSALMFAAQYSYLLRVVAKEAMARTLSLYYGAFNAGIIFGGFAGGLLAESLGLEAPLLFYSGILFGAAFLFWRFIPTLPSAASGSAGTLGSLGRLREVLKTPGFGTVVAVNFAYMWFVISIFDTLIPLFGHDELGMSEAQIGIAFAIAIAAEFAILYPAGSLTDKYGRKPVMVPSLVALTLSCAAVGWATSTATLGALMLVLGLASGFAGVPPAAMLSDVIPEKSSGTGVGMFRFAGDLSFVFGPLVAGFSATVFGFKGAFAVATIPVIVALVLVIRAPETTKLRDARVALEEAEA